MGISPGFDILWNKKIQTESFFKKHAIKIAAPILETFGDQAYSWKKVQKTWNPVRQQLESRKWKLKLFWVKSLLNICHWKLRPVPLGLVGEKVKNKIFYTEKNSMKNGIGKWSEFDIL